MHRLGFTMIELIFVIVVMGIIGKFGVEFLAQAYKSFIFSSVNNSLQAKGEMAVETVASRLQYRIKDSIIGRKSTNFNSFKAPASILSTEYADYDILEWVGIDIDGFRATSLPLWSGIIDLDQSKNLGTSTLISPGTDTGALDTLIGVLSHGSGTGVDDAALYFIGSNSDIITGYGWDGTAITDQNATMHPIKSGSSTNRFDSNASDFSGVDVYEYYQLAWTAYAVGIDDWNGTVGTLKLWYDYQPWEGERYNVHGRYFKLMENVSTFQYKAVGSIIKIQVCVKDHLVEDYSLCKEKTIF